MYVTLHVKSCHFFLLSGECYIFVLSLNVHSIYCSHHAWVSFVGFTEAYNEHVESKGVNEESNLHTWRKQLLCATSNYAGLYSL